MHGHLACAFDLGAARSLTMGHAALLHIFHLQELDKVHKRVAKAIEQEHRDKYDAVLSVLSSAQEEVCHLMPFSCGIRLALHDQSSTYFGASTMTY